MAIDFPDNPSVNDTHTVLGRTWKWNGESWKVVGSAVRGISLRVSDTAPSDPAPVSGDMWYESDTGRTFTYYDSTWVELGNTASVTSFLADADADTRIHVEESADEDTIRFDTAGTERMTISSTGAVAMTGDLTVDGDLTVSGTTTTLNTTELLVEDNKITLNSGATGSATVDAGIEVERGDDANVEILWDETADAWKIATDFTVDAGTLHVNSTNNRVGINTTSPGALFHVNDSSSAAFALQTGTAFYLTSSTTAGMEVSTLNTAQSPSSGFLYFSDQNYSDRGGIRYDHQDNKLHLRVNRGDKISIDSSGNVGIGTTAPISPLHINGSGNLLSLQSTATTDRSSIKFLTDGSDWEIGARGSAATPGNSLYFYDNDSSSYRMVIDTSGNVGIGTTSPNQTLDVDGSIAARGRIVTGQSTFTQTPWSASTIALGNYGSVGTQGSYGTGLAWNFERGTDSGWYSLGVNGFTSAGMVSIRNDGIRFHFDSSYGATTEPSTRMIVNASGNVGIGTTGPLQALHVNGMILADMGDEGFGFERSGTQSSWALRKGGTGSLSGDAVMIGNVNNNYLEFWTNNTRHGFMRSDGALYMTAVYNDTNAAGANMVILSSGQIMRSTSSAKYKTDIETLDEQHADLIYDLRPVWYRSTIETDIEGYSYYGLIAEEVAEVDPRLVHFGASLDCSCVAPEGEHLEHTKECLSEPEGVQYDRIVPHLISVAQRQKETIDALTARIEALEAG